MTATTLPNGKALIVGPSGKSVELYDPVTRTFSLIEPLCDHGHRPSATLLADGTVLIVGSPPESRCAEIYDPETGGFSRVGDSNVAHQMHSATLLGGGGGDGRVLIAGGAERAGDGPWVAHAVAEIFEPGGGDL